MANSCKKQWKVTKKRLCRCRDNDWRNISGAFRINGILNADVWAQVIQHAYPTWREIIKVKIFSSEHCSSDSECQKHCEDSNLWVESNFPLLSSDDVSSKKVFCLWFSVRMTLLDDFVREENFHEITGIKFHSINFIFKYLRFVVVWKCSRRWVDEKVELWVIHRIWLSLQVFWIALHDLECNKLTIERFCLLRHQKLKGRLWNSWAQPLES